jgi:hypothetical protein
LLSTEKVKTFYLFWHAKRAEPTVQQEETPQPPPEKPPGETDGDIFLPEPEAQQKEEIIFFTLSEEQFGHVVSFVLQLMF